MEKKIKKPGKTAKAAHAVKVGKAAAKTPAVEMKASETIEAPAAIAAEPVSAPSPLPARKPASKPSAKPAAQSKSAHVRLHRTASMDDPAVAAAVDMRFRFANEIQALAMLERFTRQFIMAKDSPVPEGGTVPFIKLWIRDYAITEEEKNQGARGNYARVSIKRVEGGRYALLAEKLDIDVKHHPQRERPKTRHPNWGHPILRAVETGKIYPSLKEAQKQIMLLHEEYPEVTIPGQDTLHAMVYSRKEGENKPIQKIVIKVKLVPEGGARLVLKEKQKKKQETTQLPAQKLQAEQPPPGKFSTMVVQRRKRKSYRPPVTSTPAS